MYTFTTRQLSYWGSASGSNTPKSPPILDSLDLSIRSGLITGIIGPNGSGKSTLLKMLSGQTLPGQGELHILGEPSPSWNRRDLARELAMLPQSSPVPAGITVKELVGCGRYPWVGAFGRMASRDYAAVDEAIERTGLEHLADRQVAHLSGGERQRTWLAVALAQDTKVLLLDEPTSWLDITHQLNLVNTVQTLNRDKGVTVLWVLHDLNQAAQFSDELIVLKEGRLCKHGRAEQVVNETLLRDVFNVSAEQAHVPGRSETVWVPLIESAQATKAAV
ncbi:ABC transporter ATP-binding protein [Parendozoicomonas haliclonae]|uniref:Iron(3+)-hydroxamate import ATP-binding protein FhuC n=1 Tax=Parendozoicomonas haliclonae TaxID=1960125 RepID=A0A1X7ARI5_9GAMM|nr:ABC transporter ATP-binding protein [Parendozoicomonas haliclonae]SMA50924.1 Iron(3+)-hydroxamate import ATP-binding protein FhuC [Parendozoicomonas haliclonae]